METGGEEILSSYDVRGPHSRIFRLFAFDKEGFIHMLFYRIAIFVAIVTGVYALIHIIFNVLNLTILYIMIAIVWALLTPQIFESAKVISIDATKAKLFGHLQKSFIDSSEKLPAWKKLIFGSLPYFVLVIWLAGLAVFIFGVLI